MFVALNWIDWAIIVVAGYYVLRGWETGAVYLTGSLVSFLGALWLAVRFHAEVGGFITQKFGIADTWATVLGYIIIALVAEAIFAEMIGVYLRRLPKSFARSRINKWLGSGLSLLNGLVIIAFFLLIIMALPLRGTIKKDIRQSKIGRFLIFSAEKYGGSVTSTIDEAARDVVKFLTVAPQSRERISLDVFPKTSELTLDHAAEQTMLELVNAERSKTGAPGLVVDPLIVPVARNHSRDMFERSYFSHISPEGKSARDRMIAGGVKFTLAGENLAYAPDLVAAHTGLMESEGHRRNILDPQFHRIGIGVVATEFYGKMFTQNFAD
ncbi:MAG: CvpA family protein [bacterium]|nr:CvpA family protein [bacterium]